MMNRRDVTLAFLAIVLIAASAPAQYVGYVANPSGISYGTSPSVLSLQVDTAFPRAIVRKNDGSAFQTSGTMRLYQNGTQVASAAQAAGAYSITLPFSWNFTSGTRTYYAMTTTNPYQSGSVSVTAGYIPAPPGGVTASAASPSSVAINWNAVAGATRYKVRYVNTNAQTGDLTSTSYTWSGLAAGTNHCFVVLACGDPNFCSAPSAQSCSKTAAEKYKIGVVLYRNGMSIGDIAVVLDSIKRDIANSRPVRTGSNGREVRLVVQMDVGWAETEPSRGAYDFQWLKEFARLCESKGIKWTPLLSAHYVPAWAYSSYDAQRLRNMQGQIVADDSNPFLKFSPSSSVWGLETRAWIRAFIDAMAYDGAYNHFVNGAIDELLIGNEMMYPSAMLTSKDSASQQKWRDRYGTTAFPTTFTTTYQTFRAEELSYAITAIVKAATDRLREIGMSQVGVSSKLYPFYFPRSGDVESDRWRGYTNSSISFINTNFSGLFALDSYPNSFCGKSWSPASDYSAARSRTSLPLYVAEFNRNKYDCLTPLTRAQTSSTATSGFQSYGVRTFVFFAWNPTGADAALAITADQKLGLADAMNWVVP